MTNFEFDNIFFNQLIEYYCTFSDYEVNISDDDRTIDVNIFHEADYDWEYIYNETKILANNLKRHGVTDTEYTVHYHIFMGLPDDKPLEEIYVIRREFSIWVNSLNKLLENTNNVYVSININDLDNEEVENLKYISKHYNINRKFLVYF